MYISLITFNEAGLPSLKVPALSLLIKGEWEEMSPEEQTEVTADALKELEERSEMKALVGHNVPMAAFRDVYATQQNIGTQVRLSDLDFDLGP